MATTNLVVDLAGLAILVVVLAEVRALRKAVAASGEPRQRETRVDVAEEEIPASERQTVLPPARRRR